MTLSSEVNIAEVLRLFVRLESEKYTIGDISSWLTLPDSELINRVQNWQRRDTNPVLHWTIGPAKDMVVRWKAKVVKIDSLYTCGINDEINATLELVAWNLAVFADRFASCYSEFQAWRSTTQNDKLICVNMSDPSRTGTAQLIDGAHRAVALHLNGVQEYPCYMAEIKE